MLIFVLATLYIDLNLNVRNVGALTHKLKSSEATFAELRTEPSLNIKEKVLDD